MSKNFFVAGEENTVVDLQPTMGGNEEEEVVIAVDDDENESSPPLARLNPDCLCTVLEYLSAARAAHPSVHYNPLEDPRERQRSFAAEALARH